jgi:hypothetical protein
VRNFSEILQREVSELTNKLDIKKFCPSRFGRISSATDRNLNILQELKEEGLSYSAIAERMIGYTSEDWSKNNLQVPKKANYTMVYQDILW